MLKWIFKSSEGYCQVPVSLESWEFFFYPPLWSALTSQTHHLQNDTTASTINGIHLINNLLVKMRSEAQMAEITNIMNGKNSGQQDKCTALQKKS